MATDRSLKAKARQDEAKETVMLAHSFSQKKHVFHTPQSKRQVDVSNWLVYQKLDGVRAIFDGITLRSRTNRPFSAPREFIERVKQFLPGRTLDGELTHPRGFQDAVSIIRDQSEKATIEYWDQISYTVYDIIDPNISFFNREMEITVGCQKENPSVSYLYRQKSYKAGLANMRKNSWEGLMLRNPAAFYEFGRSHNLLKYKEFITIEAKVTGYYPGEGKHEGRIGGVWCLLDGNRVFKCGAGFTDAEREAPPAIGSMITIKFVDYTNDKIPKSPVYLEVRNYE